MKSLHDSLRRYKRLTILLAMVAAVLVAHEIKLYLNRSRFLQEGGHATRSPDGRWIAYLASGHIPVENRKKWGTMPVRRYLRVQLFDRNLPENADLELFPTPQQEQNPTAEIFVPVGIVARSTVLEWNATSDILRVMQPEFGGDLPASVHELRIKTMSWMKVELSKP